MLVIRLARIGRRNAPKYRIVLQESSQAPKASAKEILGSYDPSLRERKEQIQLNADRAKYWISVGAQPSNTVHNMLVEFGVIEAPKRRSVQPKKKPPTEEELAAQKAAEEAAKAPAEQPAEAEEKPAEAAPAEEPKKE